jgi:trimeric autotransporter adhesin
MKKLLTLIVVFVSTLSFSQGWNYIGSSLGIATATESDIEITPGGNLYAASLSSGVISVRKWNPGNSTWTSLPAISAIPGTSAGLELVVLGETTPVVAVKSNQGALPSQFLYIYKYNGTSWVFQTMGPGG